MPQNLWMYLIAYKDPENKSEWVQVGLSRTEQDKNSGKGKRKTVVTE